MAELRLKREATAVILGEAGIVIINLFVIGKAGTVHQTHFTYSKCLFPDCAYEVCIVSDVDFLRVDGDEAV